MSSKRVRLRPSTCHKPSNSGLDFQHAATMPQVVCPEFISDGRPRANQRHLAAQYVYELRQFIQAGLSNESSDGSNARIFLDFENGSCAVRGSFTNLPGYELIDVFLMNLGVAIRVHGTKLQKGKGLAVLPQPLLAKQNWPLGG